MNNHMYLVHHGIKGMKWGVRRFQNKDGSLTSAGKQRYGDEKETKEKFWTDERKATAKKVAIGVGAVAVTAVVAYSAYKIGKNYVNSKAASKMSTSMTDPEVKERLLKAVKDGDNPYLPKQFSPERFEPERFEPERFEPERIQIPRTTVQRTPVQRASVRKTSPSEFTWERHLAMRPDGSTVGFDFPVKEQRKEYADFIARSSTGKTSGAEYDSEYNRMLSLYREHGITY